MAVEKSSGSAAVGKRRRLVIGFVSSTIYARLRELILQFRKTTDNVELVMLESTTLDQIAALKEGSIDIGFGCIRFEDAAVRCIVLRDEEMIAVFPMDHPLAGGEGPVLLHDLSDEPQIIYPRAPRPSYADQVISPNRPHRRSS